MSTADAYNSATSIDARFYDRFYSLFCTIHKYIHAYIKYCMQIGPRTTVIELGAGTGLLGMVCKLIGASTVILTDHDSVSINHMVLDSQRNGVDVSVRHLNWYDPKLDGLPAISFETNGGDLLVVAGDVLYKQPLVRPFFETVRLLLSSSSLAPLTSSRRMLLCHVPRAGVTHEIVMDSAAAAGLVAVEVLPDEWKRGDCCRYCDADDLLRAKLLEITLS